jgi:hypothetical protein
MRRTEVRPICNRRAIVGLKSCGNRPAQALAVAPCLLQSGANPFAQDLPLEQDRQQAG